MALVSGHINSVTLHQAWLPLVGLPFGIYPGPLNLAIRPWEG